MWLIMHQPTVVVITAAAAVIHDAVVDVVSLVATVLVKLL